MKLFNRAGKYSEESKPNRKLWLAILVSAAIICIAVAAVIFLSGDDSELSETQPTVLTEPTTVPTETTAPTTLSTEPTTAPTEPTEPEETEPPVREVMEKFRERHEENPEFFGWLTVDGTNIDYPVMQSVDDNNKYLKTDENGNYDYAGIPFVDIKCSLDSDNLLIYGHNMPNGSMFHTLLRYEDESFWEEYPTIQFSDLYEDYEYEVLAVFRDRVYYKYEDVFKFYQFIDAQTEADFDYAIAQFKEKSAYDTGVTAEYGDKLITLITCAYHVEDGRFVVVARRK